MHGAQWISRWISRWIKLWITLLAIGMVRERGSCDSSVEQTRNAAISRPTTWCIVGAFHVKQSGRSRTVVAAAVRLGQYARD